MPVVPFRSIPYVVTGPGVGGGGLPDAGSVVFFVDVFPMFFTLMGPTSRVTGPTYVGWAEITPAVIRAALDDDSITTITSVPPTVGSSGPVFGVLRFGWGK